MYFKMSHGVLMVGGGETAHGARPRLVSHQPATI